MLKRVLREVFFQSALFLLASSVAFSAKHVGFLIPLMVSWLIFVIFCEVLLMTLIRLIFKEQGRTLPRNLKEWVSQHGMDFLVVVVVTMVAFFVVALVLLSKHVAW